MILIVIIFPIKPQNRPAVQFYTLNDCLTSCYNAIYRCSPGLKLTQNPENFTQVFFRRLAAAYRLAFYSYDILVSSNSPFFLIEPQNQSVVYFYTLNDC